jgi:alkylation response protein AidB-like acyl-CoA dehydrogenase
MSFTEEQEQLRATVRDLFAAPPRDRPLWTVLCREIGATALAVPEEYGGFGASLVEVGIVLEEAGAALLPGPYLSTVVSAVLAGLATGERVAALALAGECVVERGRLSGVKEYVLDGAQADLYVVSAVCEGEPALYLAERAEVTACPTLDQTRTLARCAFHDVPATRLDAPVDRALDLARAAIAVESVGVARASLARTVEYLKTRTQFGVPLATFQALRHRVADLAVALAAATSSAWYAIRAADQPDFPVAARVAKLVATEAAVTVTGQSIQLHGGIGFTWEHPAHRYFKRATANRQLFGDPVTLRREIGALAGITTLAPGRPGTGRCNPRPAA